MSWNDFFQKLSGGLESVRQRVDVEDHDQANTLAINVLDQTKNSRAEAFMRRMASAVDAVLSQEIIRTPSGRAFVPEQFIVFLNPEDDRDWQGAKREFVRGELATIILDEARKRAGDNALTADRIDIELRVDGTLEADELRAQAIYDGGSEMTVVADSEKTVVVGSKAGSQADGEQTYVPPAAPLYTIEVRRGEQPPTIVPIYKNKILIGRGTASVPVDVPLKAESVSRHHATLERDAAGVFHLTHLGANPTVVGDAELPAREPISFTPAQPITIGEYSLRVELPGEETVVAQTPTNNS